MNSADFVDVKVKCLELAIQIFNNPTNNGHVEMRTIEEIADDLVEWAYNADTRFKELEAKRQNN